MSTLLSYQNEAYNRQIIPTLKNNQNWNWGSWPAAFQKLLLENGLKLE